MLTFLKKKMYAITHAVSESRIPGAIASFTSRLAGTITGAVTGLLSGFVPGTYKYFLSGPENLFHNKVSYASPFLYLVSLPVFMVKHLYKGAKEGAQNGFLAGFKYPKKLNDNYLLDKEAYETQLEIVPYSHPKSNYTPFLLSDNEIQQFRQILDTKRNKNENVNQLAAELSNYDAYLNKRSPISKVKNIGEIKNPVGLKINNKTYIDDAIYLSNWVRTCSEMKNHAQVILSDEDLPQIIKAKNIADPKSCYPKEISDFVNKVRQLLNIKKNMYQILGAKKPVQEVEVQKVVENKPSLEKAERHDNNLPSDLVIKKTLPKIPPQNETELPPVIPVSKTCGR